MDLVPMHNFLMDYMLDFLLFSLIVAIMVYSIHGVQDESIFVKVFLVIIWIVVLVCAFSELVILHQ